MTKKQNRSFKDVDELKGHGKKPNQRMKHFLVLQYLLRETDKEHFAKTADIIDHLKTQGIYADPRSIYKDIYFKLLPAPPLKQAQCLFITVHGFLSEFSRAAEQHEFVNLKIKTKVFHKNLPFFWILKIHIQTYKLFVNNKKNTPIHGSI